MKRKYLFVLLAMAIIAGGCRKYVEIEQVSVRTLKYTSDFRYTMNNNSVLEGAYGYPILSGDDTDITDATRVNSLSDIYGNAYSWASKYTSETQSDGDWEKLYKTIYTCNEVLAGVLTSLNGTEAEKQKIYGEALVHRAYSYLILVNLYGKQYSASTSSTDLGVPLLLTPNLYTSLKRASVADVYNSILADLKTSVNKLPNLPDYNVRPAKVSAYAVLARTYLNMRDFTRAGLYADSALNLQNTLLDLKSYEALPSSIPVRLKDPEVILSKVTNVTYTAISISDDLLTAMGANDLRYKLFTNTRSAFGTALISIISGT